MSKGDSAGNGGEWDGMDEEVKFAGKKMFEAPVDHKKQERDKHEQELALKMAVLAASEKGRGMSDREPSVSHEFAVEQNKDFQKKEERRINTETYGANIPAATAKAAFYSELSNLEQKINHEKRALEAEKDLSPKDQARAEKKRRRKGEVVTPRERKHYQEMLTAKSLGTTEEFGRKKEQAFREIQEAMKEHKRAFRRMMKTGGYPPLPKTWNDGKYPSFLLTEIAMYCKHLED